MQRGRQELWKCARYGAMCALAGGVLAGSARAQQARVAGDRLPEAPSAVLESASVGDSAKFYNRGIESGVSTSGEFFGLQQSSQDQPAGAAAAQSTGVQNADSAAEAKREQARRELEQEERQRVLGVVPNFNTVIGGQAAALSPGQKFHLAFKSIVDPFTFVAAGFDSAISQATDDYAGYGQGWQGYGKRFGASYADTADGTLWGNAILPVLLREDPRYFRMGHGAIKRRILYAAATTVIAKQDNGKWGPNIANVAGNLVAGGISNLYYPSTDRGVGLTFERGFTVTAEGAIGAEFDEFWPDISKHLFNRKPRKGIDRP